jgi:hypothetical protein
MPRLRRYLPPLLLLLPVIFICGKLLLTPVQGENNGPATNWQQGWPWVFQEIQRVDNSKSPYQPAPLASPMALSTAPLCAGLRPRTALRPKVSYSAIQTSSFMRHSP